MAVREVKGRKRPFVVYWINPFTNRRESKSCATKEDAEKLDAYVKYQLKYERDSFRRDEAADGSAAKQQTLETVLYQYLRERNLDFVNLDRTLHAIKGILAQYGNVEIGKVDAALLTAMKERLVSRGNKGTTIRRKMATVHAAMAWAHRNGIIQTMPLFPIIHNATDYAKYVPPSQEEAALLYRVSPEHVRRVVVLGFNFGMRVGPSELMRLRWNDVDVAGGVIRVPNAKKGAGEPWREVPIQQALVPVLRGWQEADMARGVQYVVSYKGRPVRSVRSAWKRALALAGIERHIRPYDLRHGFATEAIAAGVDYGTVAALMGHRSEVMVLRHYQHVRDAQKKAAVEAIPAAARCVQTDVYKQ